MTVNEYLKSKEPNIHIVPEEFLREYAKLKCKELLEIVAEKAKTEYDLDDDYRVVVNKGSILNAVDLEIFIV